MKNFRFALLTLVLTSANANAQMLAGTAAQILSVNVGSQVASVLPADRDNTANWQKAGLLSIGGRPSRTTQCGSAVAATGTTADFANIQTAINNCTPGQYVQLGSGTFNTNTGCVLLNKGITLRGAGPGVTNLVVSNGATLNNVNPGVHADCVVKVGGTPTVTNTTNLTSDAAQGALSVNVGSTAGISIGSLVLIDELANGQSMPDCCFNGGTGRVWASSDYRVMWNNHSPTVAFFDSACVGFGNGNNFSCGTNGDECAYSVRCGGVNEELHLVTDVTGSTVTFDSPLTLSYRTANTAQLRVYTGIVQQAGLESLTVQGGDQGNMMFQGCMYCWAYRVESTIWLNTGAFAFYGAAFRNQVERSWAHNAAWPVNGGGGYAINHTFGASENYVIDNIVMLANKVEVFRASGSGTVVAYNYMDDGYINGQNWVETGLNCSHLVGSHGVLHEGNHSWNTDNDFTHGSVGHCAFFRNYLTGFRAPFTRLDGVFTDDRGNTPTGVGPLRAISDHPYSYWDSFIGNIAGVAGAMGSWTYRCAAGNADSGCAPAIFNLGWNDTSVPGSLADGTMALTYPASPSGTITGPGCLTTGNCTPIVDGNYDYKTNAIQWAQSAHALPASLYLPTRPAFFVGTWPAVDPINGVVNGVPAQARWVACQPSPTAACLMP